MQSLYISGSVAKFSKKIYFSVKLRKENEEIEKHGNIFGDLLKGWFKGE